MSFAGWEVNPSPCQKCGSGVWVLWGLHLDDATRTRRGGRWCRQCVPDLAVGAFDVAVATSLTGKVVVWQRQGAELDPKSAHAFGYMLPMAQRLMDRRALERTKPGRWKLEHRDGRLWAPWNPNSSRKSGAPVPLRAGRLGRSRYTRQCVVCRTNLSEGANVMRADATRSDNWGSRDLAQLLVCSPCGSAALAESAEPDAPGRRVVGHLVAIDGGAA